jgi:hypothetical protein
MSFRWFAESFTGRRCVIKTTFSEKIYSRWCCIDRLNWHGFSECGTQLTLSSFLGSWVGERDAEKRRTPISTMWETYTP